MNEPTKSAGTYIVVSVKDLQPTPLRERIDDGDLKALGASMLEFGQQTPIKVRIPEPGIFELVDGERRRRAAVMVGIEVLEAEVVDLDDEEVIRLQLVPGSHPLHPLDEGRLFKRLRDTGLSDEEISALVPWRSGTSVRLLVGLNSLTTKVQESYLAGHLSHAVALRLARIVSPEVQERAAEAVRDCTDDDEALGILRRCYVLPLAKAIWDLETIGLNPDAPAPNCNKCQERTLAQRDLWGDVYEHRKDSDDYCTRPECWNVKVAKMAEEAMAEAKEAGVDVLSDSEAKKTFHVHGVYADAGDRAPIDHSAPWVDSEWAAGSGWTSHAGKGPIWRQVMREAGKDEKPHAFAIDSEGYPRWLYRKKDAMAALRLLEIKNKAKVRSEKAKADEPSAEAKKERERLRREEAGNAALIKACAARARVVTAETIMGPLARALLASDFQVAATMAMARGLADGEDQLQKRAAGAKGKDAAELVVEFVATWANEQDYGGKGVLEQLAASLRIDVAKVRKDAAKSTKPKSKKTTKAKSKA